MTRNSVTVAGAYHAVPGRESDFHSRGWALLRASAEQSGFLGGGVLVGGGVDELAREAGDRTVHGSTAWFGSGTVTPAAPRPPPKWKLRSVDVSTVFPPVLLFNLAVLPCLGSLNSLIRTPPLCLAVTATVTWILMPRLQRFSKKWLYPSLQTFRGRPERRTAQD
ncbi:hypothetical protein ACFYRZ_09155 [Streptomyces avermitilis]|uniref:hypothetical protein n=1 Tax=Streptomyces avermitilis TaxID=33903 RepID=UPI00369E2FB1